MPYNKKNIPRDYNFFGRWWGPYRIAISMRRSVGGRLNPLLMRCAICDGDVRRPRYRIASGTTYLCGCGVQCRRYRIAGGTIITTAMGNRLNFQHKIQLLTLPTNDNLMSPSFKKKNFSKAQVSSRLFFLGCLQALLSSLVAFPSNLEGGDQSPLPLHPMRRNNLKGQNRFPLDSKEPISLLWGVRFHCSSKVKFHCSFSWICQIVFCYNKICSKHISIINFSLCKIYVKFEKCVLIDILNYIINIYLNKNLY